MKPAASLARIKNRISAQTGEDLRTAFLSFAVALGMMALVYFCIGVPFFGNSVLVLDLNGQYVYFFESLHDAIYHGGSLLWSWGRSLGGEYMGIFAYYLASPFSWLVALLPSAVITEALYVMIVLKIGLAGGTMGWFLVRTYPTNRRNTVIFSTLYALCAWALMYGNNVMWLDAFFLFPLIIRGADLLLSGKNYLLYTLSLALCILSNFYMGYMVCVFLVIYFVYFHVVRSGDEDYNPKKQKGFFFRSAARYLLFTLIACGIGAVIIFSAAYSLSFGKNTFTDPIYEFTFKLKFLDLVYKLLPGAIDTVRREGLPFLYCGTAALLGASIFFVSGKFKIREKFGTGLLFLILALCFSVSVIDIWWHGGQEPNWLNYRYSYMFTFFLLVCGYRGFARLEKVKTRYLAIVPAVIFLFYIILQAHGYGTGYVYTDGVFPKAYSYDLFYYFLGILVTGGVFAGILFYKKNTARRAGTVALLVAILGEAALMGVIHHVGLAMDVGYSGRADYARFMKKTTEAVDAVTSEDDGFYRMDKTFHRQPADAMALSIRSLSSTTSTLNRRTLAFLSRTGVAAGSYWSAYKDGNPATDMLFGVKYILTEKRFEKDLYELVYENGKTGIYGYRNPRALPLAYGVHEEALKIDFASYELPPLLLNDLIAAMTGRDDLRPFIRADSYTVSLDGLTASHSSSSGHDVYTPKEGGGALTYTLTCPEDGVYCMYIPTDYPRECTLSVDGEERGLYLDESVTWIVTLGDFRKDSAHEIKLSAEEKKIYIKEGLPFFWRFDEDAVGTAYEILSPGGLSIDAGFKEDRLSGTVTVSADAPYLFTSIPYDEGWIVKVDGEAVRPLLFEAEVFDKKTGESRGIEEQPYADALIMLKLEPGTHRVELVYRPKCVIFGGLVSIGSTVLLVGIALLDLLVRRIKKKKAEAGTANEKTAENEPENAPDKKPGAAPAVDERPEREEETG